MNTVATHLPSSTPQSASSTSCGAKYMELIPMPALKLAQLNIGVFSQLRHLGTSKSRICAVLNLSEKEYDYIAQLW